MHKTPQSDAQDFSAMTFDRTLKEHMTAARRGHAEDARKLLQLLKSLAETRVQRGWYLMVAGRFLAEFKPQQSRAIWRYYSLAESLLAEDPDGLGAVMTVMVRYLVSSKEYGWALEILERWWAKPFATSSRYTPHLLGLQGIACVYTRNVEKADTYLRAAISCLEGQHEFTCYLGVIWYRLGQVRRAQGDTNGALEAFRTAERFILPVDREWVFLARAWLDLASGDIVSAHANYYLAMDRVRAVSPGNLTFLTVELGLLSVALAEEGGALEESGQLRRALQRVSAANGLSDSTVVPFDLNALRRNLA